MTKKENHASVTAYVGEEIKLGIKELCNKTGRSESDIATVALQGYLSSCSAAFPAQEANIKSFQNHMMEMLDLYTQSLKDMKAAESRIKKELSIELEVLNELHEKNSKLEADNIQISNERDLLLEENNELKERNKQLSNDLGQFHNDSEEILKLRNEIVSLKEEINLLNAKHIEETKQIYDANLVTLINALKSEQPKQ